MNLLVNSIASGSVQAWEATCRPGPCLRADALGSSGAVRYAQGS